VETVSRLRKALEDGQADAVEAAMDDAESAGVLQYILRQTVVHTGQELSTLKGVHLGWLKDTEAKMARMLRAQEEAMESKQLLLEAQAALKNMGALQRKKAFGALSGVANDRDAQLLKVSLGAWQMVIRNEKSEAKLREEYESKMQESELKIQALRVKQLSSVHGVMGKKIGENEKQLLSEILTIWVQDTQEQQTQKKIEEERARNERQMEILKNARTKVARQVMERIAGASGLDLCKILLSIWFEDVAEIKRNRKTDAAIATVENKLKGLLKNHKNNATYVLNSIYRVGNEDIVGELFGVWEMRVLEERRMAKLIDQLDRLAEKTKGTSLRTRLAAVFVMSRVVSNFDTMRLLRCFSAWVSAYTTNCLKNFYDRKIDTKRHQLQSVQNLFREFAGRLETGIIKSPREDSSLGGRGGFKQDGGVVLPDIGPTSAPSNNGRPPTAPLRRENSASQSSLRRDRPQTAGGTSSVSIRSPPEPIRDTAPGVDRHQDRSQSRRDSREPSRESVET